MYPIAGKFGGGRKFGKSSTICQTKVIVTINNLLTDLFIHQIQIFLLYNIQYTQQQCSPNLS